MLYNSFFSPFSYLSLYLFFFFNDTATTEIYTLSLHDALPIYRVGEVRRDELRAASAAALVDLFPQRYLDRIKRSEEHTSELQSPDHLVCRLLLEKKKMTEFDTRLRHKRLLSHTLIHPEV